MCPVVSPLAPEAMVFSPYDACILGIFLRSLFYGQKIFKISAKTFG
jgi:hypothetical protein